MRNAKVYNLMREGIIFLELFIKKTMTFSKELVQSSEESAGRCDAGPMSVFKGLTPYASD